MKETFNIFYKHLTGFTPYQYQIKAVELLLSGKNVILSVPTGAGKTWASVMPFLYATQNKISDFPQKMIYSLPLRTLANSIYNDIEATLNKEDTQALYPELSKLISIQTGEYSDDPYFEKRIIFSTIDQTLSNFLCFPLPLSQRQANINAGALIGSYLIFDEFHLLEPKLSMATSLGMIRILKNLCHVCIMTATLTDDYIQFIKNELGFEVVSINDFPEDIDKINSLKPAEGKIIKKSVTVCSDKKINASDILDKHKDKTIVICNRVETAQKLYLELEKHKPKETMLFCIHSRYFDSDRKQQEQKVKEYFGKDNKKQNAILIATQVIEAGMDISCDTMHTEISPINSFLQRVGRCARFANEYGDIFVYDVLNLEEKEKIKIETEDKDDRAEIKKLNNKYLPYSKKLCEKSLIELSKYDSINENTAIALVNTILREDESQKIGNITANLYNIVRIRESWNDCNKNHYKETIRDIQGIEIVLIDLENWKNKEIIPWKYETISIYKWSFIGWAKQIEQNKIAPDDWVFAKAIHGEESVFDFEWQDKDSCFLRRLQFEELKNHFDVVFVDNRYFDYTTAGLMVHSNDNNISSPIKDSREKNKQIITYKKDTFYQHNKALLNCFETEFKPYLKFTFNELDRFWGGKNDWEQLIRLTICLHDYGKLNAAWQKPMKEFQKRKTGIDNPTEVLAHTDYDDSIDKELAKECRIKSKPPHAGIGALQAYEILYDEYSESIAKGVCNAILKHHSPETKSFPDFFISDICIKEMEHLLMEYKIKGNLIKKERGELLDDIIPNNDKEWILYFFVVRILRLCDQKATESFEKYYI
ncbi:MULTISPECIES: CRISPR-associated helicase/endonuclease Cas3 [Proteiniphilum]|uniref:CRISPR-associated helicase/endonuclease Cas3 n=1 Tax=Proteiniphilum TaxID=294702 RepID=UPI0003601374|nr:MULTISPECIES: CRISPR-associated helicase/endonuclease Cas3 [Proteiniphilum]